jgi:hypothetical protein
VCREGKRPGHPRAGQAHHQVGAVRQPGSWFLASGLVRLAYLRHPSQTPRLCR